MGEHDGVYRYVRWSDVEDFRARGWEVAELSGPTHHDAYSVLMQWMGKGEHPSDEEERRS